MEHENKEHKFDFLVDKKNENTEAEKADKLSAHPVITHHKSQSDQTLTVDNFYHTIP